MTRSFWDRRLGRPLLAGFLTVLAATPALAQTSRGTVVGIVTDASGGIIPGAAVVLTHPATGGVRSTLTNEAGLYRFDAVDLGVYNLKITMPGFQVFQSTAFGVEANRTTTIDAKLDVGSHDTVVEVHAETAELLAKDAPLRGGNFQPQEVSRMSLGARNPIALARTLPGVVLASGSTVEVSDTSVGFVVNGQRPRGNNYLLDGSENNHVVLGGPVQALDIADAVQEVSAQTSNFGVEFGRAGGGVFNVITKSGANDLHGTLFWQYRSERFNSIANLERLNGTPPSVFSQNIYGFTLGGPVRRNTTFFFGAFQQDRLHSAGNRTFVLPTAEAVARLRALFPSNPRLDLYLNALGPLRGSANPFNLALGPDPVTGADRGAVAFGSATAGIPLTDESPQGLLRLDHNASEAHRLSFRYVYNARQTSPTAVKLPGYIAETTVRGQNFPATAKFHLHVSGEIKLYEKHTKLPTTHVVADRG